MDDLLARTLKKWFIAVRFGQVRGLTPTENAPYYNITILHPDDIFSSEQFGEFIFDGLTPISSTTRSEVITTTLTVASRLVGYRLGTTQRSKEAFAVIQALKSQGGEIIIAVGGIPEESAEKHVQALVNHLQIMNLVSY